MKITHVFVRLIPGKERLKGIAGIILDEELAINDIKIVQTARRMCIEFPKHQFAKNKRMEYIVPLTPRMRGVLEGRILEEYKRKKEEAG